MTEQLIIAGERRDAAEGATFTVTEPATGKPLAEVAKASAVDVDLALTAAAKAFADGRGTWARTSGTERGRVLLRVSQLIREREDQLATAEARGAGHPIGDARWEVGAAAGTFEYYAGAANKHFGSVVPVQDAGLDVVLREPVGPVGLIVPWNFPLLIACWKLAPALACGNPVILKPASLTPLTALLLGDILVEAGVPADQVYVLPGPGGIIGDALVSDHRTAKISFTGETTTGASILKASADHIARVSLELGGKSAAIVFADADVQKAAADAPMSVFGNAGQDCCARSRILVERPVYDEFLEAFEAATRAIKVGDPLDAATPVELQQAIDAAMRLELARMQDHLSLLRRMSAREKVASFLTRLSGPHAVSPALPMGRQDVADFLGLTMETVSRVLSQFERDGVLRFAGPRQFEVHRPQVLAALAA